MRITSAFRFRTLAAVLVIAGVLVAMLATVVGAQQAGPTVDVLQISGAIDRTMASYVEDAIAKAEREGVEAVVVQLDSPGALGVEPQRLVDAVAGSRVPIAVWVGPPAARAGGAALYLAQAADVLAVGPVTVLGPAVPAGLDRVRPDAAAADDAARRLTELAERSGRSGDEAGALATTSTVVSTVGTLPPGVELPGGTDADGRVVELDEAAVVGQGMADIVAPDLDDVLRELDGRTVTVAAADGDTERTLDIDPVTTRVRFNNPGLLTRILHTMASPTLVYLLLVAGVVVMLFELYQPGFGVAGVTGLALFALSVYGLVLLPTRWWAFALLLAGLAVLAVDLALAGLGALTLVGAASLTAGSLLLFAPPLGVPVWLVVAVVAFCLLFFVVIMTTVLRAQGAQAQAGAERVIGKIGVVRSMLNPEGHVFVGGALWRARAPDGAGKVRTGTSVRVVGMSDGLTLDVVLENSDVQSTVRTEGAPR